jgi:hypothetical protein
MMLLYVRPCMSLVGVIFVDQSSPFFCPRSYFTRSMRLFKLFSPLTLLFGARASSLKSREPAPHPLDVRDLLDLCAPIDREFVVPNSLGVLLSFGVLGRSTPHRILSVSVPDQVSYRCLPLSVGNSWLHSVRLFCHSGGEPLRIGGCHRCLDKLCT